ncbi:MAG: hypothetical protein O3B00_03310 [archaeon]|jgi:hypothetical protein|nr:hypothetical protein [archaeon]MDA1130510.1 hypothetical protein [archaeon]
MGTSKALDEILDEFTSNESKSHRDIWTELPVDSKYSSLDDSELNKLIEKFESELDDRRKWFISELLANRYPPASKYLFANTPRFTSKESE